MTTDRAACKRSKHAAYLSECFGSISSTMINDSAVIILFASMLQMGDTFSLLTTSFRSISSTLLLIPCAWLAERMGYRKAIQTSAVICGMMFFLLSASPFFGSGARIAMLSGSVIFCMSLPLYVSAWFPLVDGFLAKEERGNFFGTNRFLWMSASAVLIFIFGMIIGKNPSIERLQMIVAFTGLLCFGRFFFIGRIVEAPRAQEGPSFVEALKMSLSNAPLCGFSIYLFCLYLASYSTIPLGFMFLKNHLRVPDNTLVMISSLTMAGTMAGYLSAGKLLRRIGSRPMLLVVHLLFGAVNFALFSCDGITTFWIVLLTVLLTFHGFLTACSSVVSSTEMMALARPGNKAMAMAFCGSFLSGGMGLSRLAGSLAIGSGMFAARWQFCGREVTHYQSLFLIAGCVVVLCCLLLVLVPAVVSSRDYYYEPR